MVLKDLRSAYVSKNCCGRRDWAIFRLTDRRAPGLEQKRVGGSSGRSCLSGIIWSRCGLGTENFRGMAVNTMVKAKKQSGAVSQNAFAGQAEQPTQKAVQTALGNSCVEWNQLVSEL